MRTASVARCPRHLLVLVVVGSCVKLVGDRGRACYQQGLHNPSPTPPPLPHTPPQAVGIT